jgi:hypothetical protein
VLTAPPVQTEPPAQMGSLVQIGLVQIGLARV